MKKKFPSLGPLFGKKAPSSAEEVLFSEDRKRLLALLETMKKQVLSSLDHAMNALEKQDVKLAGKVIARDETIDALAQELEEECLYTMALRRPVRNNLRFLVGLIKVGVDLERMGDQAANIAEKVSLIGTRPLLKPLEDIPAMAAAAREMTIQAVRSFVKEDPELALQVYLQDDRVDHLYNRVFQDVLQLISRKSEFPKEDMEQAMSLVLIARYLERVGDQAVNVARQSYFITTGKSLDHQLG